MHPAAANSLFVKRAVPLKRYLTYSVVVHALLLSGALGYSALMGPAAVDLNQKPITATLVRQGKPRDEKLLPQKEEPPPPPPKAEEPAPAPAPPVPEKTAVVLPGVKPTEAKTVKQTGAKTGQDHRKELFSAFSKAAKHQELEGEATGDPNGDSAVQEGDRYYGLLRAQVRRHYDLPDTISDQERLHLKTLVHLYIGRTGQVLRVKLEGTSGNDLFDSRVLAAAKNAGPYPPPPESLRATLEKGVTLSFTP